MAASKTVLYLGTDHGYLSSIEKYYAQKYGSLDFDFVTIDVKPKLGYLASFLDMLSNPPAIIYIDFSSYLKEHIQLARLIKRENSLKDIPMCGLVDKKSEVRGCVAAGADVVHVKCGEYDDVVYDAIFLLNQKLVVPQQFARAKTEKSVHLVDDFRISYISDKGIHAEGNLVVKEGDEITIQNEIPKTIVPSQRFRVSKVEQNNLYYDTSHAYDFDFAFVDAPKAEFSELEMMIAASDDQKEKERLEKKIRDERVHRENEFKDELNFARKKVRDWVKNNSLDSSPKSTKLLLIDRNLSFVKQADRDLDRYSFTLRMQTYLQPDVPEIRSLRPSIIALQYLSLDLDSMDEGEREQFNDEITLQVNQAEEQLKMIIEYLRSCAGTYNPIVMVFNAPMLDAKDLQDRFQYPLIVLKPGHIELSGMATIAENFQRNENERREKKIRAKIAELKAKDPSKYRNLTPAFFDENRFYIKKTHDLSYAYTTYEATLMSFTESEVELAFKGELELRTYRMKFPVSMSIRLVPQKDGALAKDGADGLKIYTGLIHSIGEEDKMEIRRQINEVFFAPLKEKRHQEEAKFRELNERTLKERQEVEEAVSEADVKPDDKSEPDSNE